MSELRAGPVGIGPGEAGADADESVAALDDAPVVAPVHAARAEPAAQAAAGRDACQRVLGEGLVQQFP